MYSMKQHIPLIINMDAFSCFKLYYKVSWYQTILMTQWLQHCHCTKLKTYNPRSTTHRYGGGDGHGHREGGEGSATVLDGWSDDDHPKSVQQGTQHLVNATEPHHCHPEAQQREEEVGEL